MEPNRVLIDYLNTIRDVLLSYSRHFSNANHSDILGYCREALINEFLSKVCPSIIEYSTGEIFDSEDNRSGQIDIVMQTTNSPKIPLYENRRLSFADTVFGAIEIKSDLTTAGVENASHFKSAMDNIQKIKKLNRKVTDKYHQTIPCFLIAFKGPKIDTAINFLTKYSEAKGVSVKDCCPEVISVIEEGYSISRNDGFISAETDSQVIKWDEDPSMSVSIPFFYISRKAETWSQQQTLFNLADYFKPKNQ